MNNTIEVTIKGAAGCGKTTIYEFIKTMLEFKVKVNIANSEEFELDDVIGNLEERLHALHLAGTVVQLKTEQLARVPSKPPTYRIVSSMNDGSEYYHVEKINIYGVWESVNARIFPDFNSALAKANQLKDTDNYAPSIVYI